ncbi:uncharacterized protein [Arachis hypogaea]|uniref:uncharacterized protein n=1 Tax=Arachis hypogaea TaxID=3818 RepID=UPI000DEC272D|nr:uncharacterized protein LOC112803220 [Arachis hypogaea]
MCWNCRGAASESFSHTFLEIVRINKPDIVILLETRCSGEKARKIISKSGFDFYHIEEAVGFSGGIWVMWKDPNIVISILKSKTQYVHMNVKKDFDEDWFLTAVYASPREVNRRELWNDIKMIKNGIRGPWLVVGDFNEIADPSEKKGGGRTDVGACKRFKRWIEDCMLIDRGSVGPKFTWRGPQWENLERVFKRLDRALANADWRIKFHEARVEVLARVKSDHHPLLITMKPKDNLANNKPFRFEAMWSRHPDFKQFVESHWSGAQHWGRSLLALAENLMVWNKEVFGHIGRQKRSLMRRIGGIQKASSYGRNPFLEELERNLTNELEEILDREEIMWMQKSRDTWIIVNRLKPALKDRISPFQSSFVPGRIIHDNILIAKELTHTMKKMKGRKGFMAIKFDFEKAYDRLRWDFLKECLVDFRLEEQLLKVIMNCISTASYNALWNGGKTDFFKPSRGIRQGDPISPYLFVIAIDRLSHLIEDLVEKGVWNPITVGRQGPPISHLLFVDDLLVFGEATEKQMKVILESIKAFCVASGLKVSDTKTSITFSNNVRGTDRKAIIDLCHYKENKYLGRYLGAHITNHRKGKDKFKNVLERMQSKLKGWKSHCLSLAGRITLSKSILNPIANFDMQHMRIPKGICQKMEKMQRRFIWGDTPNQKRMHHVNWQTLCLPKNQGGMGLRRLNLVNDVFLMKLVWRLLTEPNNLWAQVFYHKYIHSRENSGINFKASDSPNWKELVKVWHIVENNCIRVVGDGTSISFWNDKWIPNEDCLARAAINPIPMEREEDLVANYIDNQGDWKLDNLYTLISPSIIDKIRAIPPPKSNLKDSLCWTKSSSGQFTIASAYKMLAEWDVNDNVDRWMRIWKWKGPERIKVFIWQLLHGKILTASRRASMMGTNPNCHHCKHEPETILHVIRDCPRAVTIWVKLINPAAVALFFNINFQGWIELNLQNSIGKSPSEWIDEFYVACWMIWKWRNLEVFSPPYVRPKNAVEVIRNSLNNYRKAYERRTQKCTINETKSQEGI